jgi:hypothetical protein
MNALIDFQVEWVDRARKEREIEGDVKHGPIHPKSDRRCFRRELLEELLDGLNYSEWAFMKGEITGRQRNRVDRKIHSVIALLQSSCLGTFART